MKIVDLTTMLSGPWATSILGDQGADVIKVEVPGKGDHVRAEIHHLAAVHLFFLKAALVQAVRHVVILQAALARLVADGTVERVVDEQELQHAAAALAHLR